MLASNLFDHIDESRAYTLDWKEEIGTKDYYVEPRVDSDPWRYTFDATDHILKGVWDPKLKYITKQEYQALPRNWSMEGMVPEDLFISCYKSSKNSTQFYDKLESYVKEHVEGQQIKGYGVNHFNIKRLCVVASTDALIEQSILDLSEDDVRLTLQRGEEAQDLFVPSLSQGRAKYAGRVGRLHTFEVVLREKKYFKFENFDYDLASDDVKLFCLEMPSFAIKRKARYLETRRLALIEKGIKLRKFYKRRK